MLVIYLGNPGTSHSLDLGGILLSITDNLGSALQGIRERIFAGDPFILLWVDAVCIDQWDLEERNQQIQQMQKIYSSAEKDLAYLGLEANGSELLPYFLPKTVVACLEVDERFNEVGQEFDYVVAESTIPTDKYEMLGQPPKSDRLWDFFVHLLARPWFLRAWIV